jgi:hypothetical protein
MRFSRRSRPRCAGGRSERQSGLSSGAGKSLSATRTSSRREAAPAADEDARDVAPELLRARLQVEPARAWQLKVEHEGPHRVCKRHERSATPAAWAVFPVIAWTPIGGSRHPSGLDEVRASIAFAVGLLGFRGK